MREREIESEGAERKSDRERVLDRNGKVSEKESYKKGRAREKVGKEE